MASQAVSCRRTERLGDDVERTLRDNAIVRYFRETRAEVRKVVWPSRQEAIRLSLIVISVMVAMSAFLGVADYLFAQVIGLIVR
jgi:preprotein translocase subunit SecE